MKTRLHLILFSALLTLSSFTSVLDPYNLTSNSKLTVTGTSTLHPWEIELEDMNCKATINLIDSQISIENLSFEAVSESFQSEHGKMMNNKIYKALKTDKYKTVVFKADEPFTATISNNSFSGKIKGTLSLAGVSKKIVVPVTGNIDAGSVNLSGETPLVMTQYEIEPPTALMGTINTGDDIVVHYHLNFKTSL